MPSVPRNAAGLMALAGVIAFVVAGVYLYVSRLSPPITAVSSTDTPARPAALGQAAEARADAQGDVYRPDIPGAMTTAGSAAQATPRTEASSGANPTLGSVALGTPGPLPTSAGRTELLTEYRDEAAGFSFALQPTWTPVVRETASDNGGPRSVVFEDPATGARIAVTHWPQIGGAATQETWIEEHAPGMASVDGRWPTEAIVAGTPSLVLWADETPDTPARYTALVPHAGDLFAITYSARDGGQLLGEYARVLVTLEWSGTDTTDLIPPLPKPAGRYFPSIAPTASG